MKAVLLLKTSLLKRFTLAGIFAAILSMLACVHDPPRTPLRPPPATNPAIEQAQAPVEPQAPAVVPISTPEQVASDPVPNIIAEAELRT